MRLREMFSFRCFVLATVLWALTGAGADAEQRVALVIANSSYKNVARLQNPPNDAAAVVALFKKAGFNSVDLHSDLNVAYMRRTLRDFAAKAPTFPLHNSVLISRTT